MYDKNEAATNEDSPKPSLENAIDALVFSAGMTLLVGGSKSSKITCCFEFFDSDGDGSLTANQFARMIKGIIISLVAFGQHNNFPSNFPADAADYVYVYSQILSLNLG